MKHNEKEINRKALICLLLLCCVASAFSQTGGTDALSSTMTSWTSKITGFLGSSWIKAVALIALVIEAVGIVVGGQQGGGGAVFKKFAPWIVGTVILLMASAICNYMYEGLSFSATA